MNDEQSSTITTGFCFRFTRSEFDQHDHAYVVISSTLESEVVLVNFTTCRSFSDESCVIEAGEHECTPKRTCVAYQFATAIPLAKLQTMLNRGDIDPRRPVPKALLDRIWDGARKSKNFPIGLRAILEKQSLIEEW